MPNLDASETKTFSGGRAMIVLAAILAVATLLRFLYLGRLSLWYDEVIPMRLARQPSAGALMQLLNRIEATRAPLQPLVLQIWLRLFGTSEIAGRSLSAVCGVLTVLLVFRIGKALYDEPTALWAAGLAALSPLLVRYSQEAKMYSWLVMLTAFSWDRLLSLRESDDFDRKAGLACSQIALAYSHPLSVFMFVAQAAAYLLNRRSFRLTIGQWLAIETIVALAVLPWVGHYMDHPPEMVTGRPSLSLLIGLPIGFVGGNRWALLACLAVVVWGLFASRGQAAQESRWGVDHPFAASVLLCWFAIPPLLLFAYSLVSYPLFGQARYTLYVGPAYLLLLSRGLVRLPLPVRVPAAIAGAILAGMLLRTMVYAPDLKADWRAAAAALRQETEQRGPIDAVITLTEDPTNAFESVTARYYLGPNVRVMTLADALADPPGLTLDAFGRVVFAVALRDGKPVAQVPDSLVPTYRLDSTPRDYPGLRLIGALVRRANLAHGF